MSDNEKSEPQRQLLEDAEFCALIERDFAQQAEPGNELSQKRVWQRLEQSLAITKEEPGIIKNPSSGRNWHPLFWLLPMAAALLFGLLPLVQKQAQQEDQWKGGTNSPLPEQLNLQLIVTESQKLIRIDSPAPAFALLYVPEAPDYRIVWQGELNPQQPLEWALSSQGFKRLCLLKNADQAALLKQYQWIKDLATVPEDARCLSLSEP